MNSIELSVIRRNTIMLLYQKEAYQMMLFTFIYFKSLTSISGISNISVDTDSPSEDLIEERNLKSSL